MKSAVLAFLIWGLLPIYWYYFRAFPAETVTLQRVFWAAVTISFYSWWIGGKSFFRAAWVLFVRAPFITSAKAGLIGGNWFLYIWAIQSGYVLETSLGYFINPLLSVAFGFLFLNERLNRMQIAAVVLIATTIVVTLLLRGYFPWIALLLASTFATYGLMSKKLRFNPMHSMLLESWLIFVPCMLLVLFVAPFGDKFFAVFASPLYILLGIGAGVLTITPLVLFAQAAGSIPLSSLGMIQYLSPSLQFLLGVFFFGEAFSQEKVVIFIAVWLGLALYQLGSKRQRSKDKKLAVKI